MADPDKGGAPLEVIKNDRAQPNCVGRFDQRGVVLWHRLHDFQFVSRGLEVIKQLLLSCFAGRLRHKAITWHRIFIPGEPARRTGHLLLACPYHAYCSPNNCIPGGAMR